MGIGMFPSGDQDQRSEQDSRAQILLDAWKLIDLLQNVTKSDNFTPDCSTVEMSRDLYHTVIHVAAILARIDWPFITGAVHCSSGEWK